MFEHSLMSWVYQGGALHCTTLALLGCGVKLGRVKVDIVLVSRHPLTGRTWCASRCSWAPTTHKV